jgi:hypothetical protein
MKMPENQTASSTEQHMFVAVSGADPAMDIFPLLDKLIVEAGHFGLARWLEKNEERVQLLGLLPPIALMDHADAQRERMHDAKKAALDFFREVVKKHALRMTALKTERDKLDRDGIVQRVAFEEKIAQLTREHVEDMNEIKRLRKRLKARRRK